MTQATTDLHAPINYAAAGAKLRTAKQKETRELVVNAGGTAYNALDDVMSDPSVPVQTKVAFGTFVERVGERVVRGEITESQLALPAGSNPAPTPSPTQPANDPAPAQQVNNAALAASNALVRELRHGIETLAGHFNASVVLVRDGDREGAIDVEATVRAITDKVAADRAAATNTANTVREEAVNAAKAEAETTYAGSVPLTRVRQHAERLTQIVDSRDWKLGHRLLGAGNKVQVPATGYTDLFNETNALRSDAGLPPLREETPATTPTPAQPAAPVAPGQP